MFFSASVALVLLSVAEAASTSIDASGTNWALLVAGSTGWQNYRAQADLCHIYHTIIDRGNVPATNVIVMMSDDIADNKQNPYPGEIFNDRSESVNVYDGCLVDFSGSEVTASTVLGILNGTAHGKSIQSNRQDNLFVVYVGHGFQDGWVMPDHSLLYAHELWATVEQMEFNLAAFYHVGQTSTYMQLPDTLNSSVYAVTASTPSESSFAYYCPTENTTKLDTCLANQFSVGWLGQLSNQQTMKENFEASKSFCLNNGSIPSSHVTAYGAVSVVQYLDISQFF